MALSVLIIPDKFKGTLTAAQAAEAVAAGWRSARPDDSLELLPMSDGGDGFGEIISHLLQAETRSVKTVDAAHRPCSAEWWWHDSTRTAVVESARVIGLALLPQRKYHPFELDTAGLGPVLQAAVSEGARRCLIGIGGSATNDGGFGMASALGWRFLNKRGEKITRWTELHGLDQVHPPEPSTWFEELLVAVDVQNQLLGPEGCTRIYGPQKGLRPDDFEFAERCLEQLAATLVRERHLDCAQEPGSGAAGGLGYGLRCFAAGRLEPGFQLFCRFADLPSRLRSKQLVITGEGAIDTSTLMGKGVGEVAHLCQRLGIPCLALGGVVANPEAAKQRFASVHSLSPDLTSQEEAMAQPALWLERLARLVADNIAQTSCLTS